MLLQHNLLDLLRQADQDTIQRTAGLMTGCRLGCALPIIGSAEVHRPRWTIREVLRLAEALRPTSMSGVRSWMRSTTLTEWIESLPTSDDRHLRSEHSSNSFQRETR